MSDMAVALGRLYGRDPLCRRIDDTQWRLQWRYPSEGLDGLELVLRVGDIRVGVCIETLTAFGAANDVTRPEIPAGLRAAYLSGVGSALWRELETVTQCAIEVLEVRPQSHLEPTPECLGFEVQRGTGGPATRGWLRCIDTDTKCSAALLRALTAASREMALPPVPKQLSLRWTAVVGCTSLPAGEARELAEHDIVLVDDVRPASDALNCWLAVGAARRYAGRLALRNGQLHMVQFGNAGESNMSSETDSGPPQEAGFADIPVNLRFELAQWNASLAEVGRLAAGTVIDIGQRLDDHSISVWAEQRCIGKGQLVVIGERLGVRLLSVFAREHV
jgi:type III secretion system YscQ/HrcQ family protein